MNSDIEFLRAEVDRLQRENAQLRQLQEESVPQPAAKAINTFQETSPSHQYLIADNQAESSVSSAQSPPVAHFTNKCSVQEKINLFRSLFKGREDVYASFWTNERTGKQGYSPACEDPWSLRKGQPRKYLPLTDQIIEDHLSGNKTIGIFPLLQDNRCWFLACDFDGEGWNLDAMAYLDICKHYGVPAYLERSRSGNGGHVWMIFSSPVTAILARQLGMRLLRQTMDVRGDLDLGSYDRFFPNQDFVPKGGFGNLIAVPLQKKCRALGNTEFLDTSNPKLHPYSDQWNFLNSIKKIQPSQLETLLQIIPPVTFGLGQFGNVSREIQVKQPSPVEVQCGLGTSVSLEKSGLPPWMLSKLKHLACLHNPEFYTRQKLRLSTHRIPRFIKCYREDFSHIHLPRGTFEEIQRIFQQAGSRLVLTDLRSHSENISFEFHGKLTTKQKEAVQAMLVHDSGVLVAPPGVGKTVMGCYAIVKRRLPTLILAHRKPILEQWRKQLTTLLGVHSSKIGQIGGGRDNQSGLVDLAMMQSLVRHENLAEFYSKYGFIIIDECHHIPAVTFETCLKEAPIRYFLGLTATPYRRDGLQDIITMQCGPIRFRMDQNTHGLELSLQTYRTNFICDTLETEMPVQEIFRNLVHHQERNDLIIHNVLETLARGRRCLILSHWKEHCQLLSDKLAEQGKFPFILYGTQGKKERTRILQAIHDTPSNKDLIVVATGQFLGEGFDCPQLDTLFLAFPVAFKGKLIQYIGRILREFQGKTSVEVYDYLDDDVPVLRRMYQKRLKTYKSLGFKA